MRTMMSRPLMLSCIAVLLLAVACSTADEISDVAEEAVDTAEDVARQAAEAMGVSDELKQALREEEGAIDRVYRDSGGLPTVGIGHLVTPRDGLRVGDRIDHDKMEAMLAEDLTLAEQAVRDLVRGLPLSQNEYDALVDLVFNVGPGRLSERDSPGLQDAIRRRDYKAIGDNLIYTRDASGRRVKGLVMRSERRRRMFMENRYDDPRKE
ncbi:MAG: lysozyme [Pseudomonadota bacterium]